MNCTQDTKMAKNAGDLDLQTRLSEEPNTFTVNLVQIRLAVIKIFHTQTKKSAACAVR